MVQTFSPDHYAIEKATRHDYAGFADTPKDASVRIPLDTRSAAALAAALSRLGRDETLRERVGRAAAAWVAQHCSPAGCADAYSRLIREAFRVSLPAA